jgi:hypothetical protein
LLIGLAVPTIAVWVGCARSHPQTEPELPPLTAPTPPPRVLPPLAGGPIDAPTVPPPPEPGRSPAPTRRRPEGSRAGENNGRQEPKSLETPKTESPEAARPEEAQPAPPAPTLQLIPDNEATATEQAIRQQLTRATNDLRHVDYGALSGEAKVQYDTAKRFMVLADQAIRDRNLIFARTLAEKAAVIAGVLLSR